MIFGAKTLYNANTNIDALFENGDLGSRTGAISLVQKDGRKTVNSGKIYFRKDFIYAVEIDNHPVPIAKRVATGGMVDYDEIKEICRVAESSTSQKVVDLLLERQLISEKKINIYIKEHFLGLMEDILSWENCEGTWIPEVSTKNFVMPYVPLHKVRSIIENRRKYRNGFTKSVQSFFDKKEIPNLVFASTKNNAVDLNDEFRVVLGFATGEHTVAEISENTGLDEFNTLQAVVGLWQEGLLDIQLGGIKLPYASLIKRVNSENEKPAEQYSEEIISLDPQPAESDEQETAEENHDEEIILRADNGTSDDYTLPNSTAEKVEEDELIEDNEPEVIESDEALEGDEYLMSPSESGQPAIDEDEDYLLMEETEPSETFELKNEGEVTVPSEEVYEEGTENTEVEPAREEVMAEDTEEEVMAEEPSEETLTEPETKEIMSTPTHNSPLRANKIQELTVRLTELQSEVAKFEERAEVSDTALEEATAEVGRLDSELAEARKRVETLKAEQQSVAYYHAKACKDVSELLSSFQIGG